MPHTVCGYSVLETVQEIDSLLGMGGGLEDGAAVLLQDLKPAANVGGVVAAWLRGDAEIAAEEGGPDFGNQLLAGVPFIGELLAAKVAVKSGGVPCPVGHLVGECRVIALGIPERNELGHLHEI